MIYLKYDFLNIYKYKNMFLYSYKYMNNQYSNTCIYVISFFKQIQMEAIKS